MYFSPGFSLGVYTLTGSRCADMCAPCFFIPTKISFDHLYRVSSRDGGAFNSRIASPWRRRVGEGQESGGRERRGVGGERRTASFHPVITLSQARC